MTELQKIFLLVYALFGLVGVYVGAKKCKFEKNNLGLVGIFVIYGAFVWADLVVFGLFWVIFSIISIVLSDWLLFLFGLSVFWFIRSLGETFYWFNQQFSTIKRYTSKDFFFSRFFKNDDYTIWFVMQIISQCVSVVSAILSVYFGSLWLESI